MERISERRMSTIPEDQLTPDQVEINREYAFSKLPWWTVVSTPEGQLVQKRSESSGAPVEVIDLMDDDIRRETADEMQWKRIAADVRIDPKTQVTAVALLPSQVSGIIPDRKASFDKESL